MKKLEVLEALIKKVIRVKWNQKILLNLGIMIISSQVKDKKVQIKIKKLLYDQIIAPFTLMDHLFSWKRSNSPYLIKFTM